MGHVTSTAVGTNRVLRSLLVRVLFEDTGGGGRERGDTHTERGPGGDEQNLVLYVRDGPFGWIRVPTTVRNHESCYRTTGPNHYYKLVPTIPRDSLTYGTV